MSTKLCQIVALASGKKSRSESAFGSIHHKLEKKELLNGISRAYTPRDEDGEKVPSESKHVQFSVSQAISEVTSVLADLLDTVATQDASNCVARASVAVDGKTLLANVPVTHLLFLEKKVTDLRTFVDGLPTLDPAYRWSYDPTTASYRADPQETTKTKKVMKNHVLVEATKEHPAQVHMYNEDVTVGTWRTTNFSGGIPAQEKNQMLDRVRKLHEAIVKAREEANSSEVVALQTSPILDYVFSGSMAQTEAQTK